MSVIDLMAVRRKRDVERRWRNEPAAAVVLLTEGGKIAAFAGRPERLPADTLFGEEDEAYWQPWSLACDLAERLRSHPAVREMMRQGFRVEAIRAG
jgi:hypothetical protein